MTPEKLDRHLQQTLSRGRVAVSVPAGCPELALYLFDPEVLEGPLSHEEAQAVVAEPAYWSFCWASGQVLARWILQNPGLVAGKTVLDFGSGSGVVAVASAMAGAARSIACDIDPAALDAAAANARLNGVDVDLCDDWGNRPEELDLITAADVLYDPENRPLLSAFESAAPQVLLADSRVKDLGAPGYIRQAVVEARTWPDLNEFEEFNQVRLYLASHPGAGKNKG
ncbi:50S ribosomal protein L11 methyltransferase [Marinobacter daepoensis]|uniref:50S ribosomal protein L11 methyltransferase n=1 Tax=Marinobacter daepoensis TaxID=262077 RepID=A0ABS3BEG1_9GAMM|nr:50S ribosomal protein L11 methyltransferase [Marinobacter daepoensis]MBN7770221.1 50S ribosomal protein L11 methyltransferase [Marinobacter daepoensis]MBY6079667.1 50S ribosomal protein L11 methyltransferase [Marinobacter daepoensis]